MKLHCLIIAPLGLLVSLAGCKPAPTMSPKAIPAVHVANPATEAGLATVTLTPEAEQRLGIITVPSTRESVKRTRLYGGDLLLPLAGTETGSTASSVYSLFPAATPAEFIRAAELQVDAEGLVAAAEVQLDAARLALRRAQELVANKAGVGRAVDEARTQVQLAEVALHTAQAKRGLLGEPVFKAVTNSVLWVRVPVYGGDLPRIDQKVAARVGGLGGTHQNWQWTATPVSVPFSSSTSAVTTDLYYQLPNQDGSLRPGQRVVLSIPLLGEDESLVVPEGGILYDVHGGTWVYENTAPHTFVRRRVELRHISEVGAVVSRGPPPGARIVSVGAAELFGTEFGAGK